MTESCICSSAAVLVGEAHDGELYLQQRGGTLLGRPVAEQSIGNGAPRQKRDGDQQHEQRPGRAVRIDHDGAISL